MTYQLEPYSALKTTHVWSQVDTTSFDVRSGNYCTNKTKNPSKSETRLLQVDMFYADTAIHNVASLDVSSFHTLSHATLETIFVVVLQLPVCSKVCHVVFFFGLEKGIFSRNRNFANLFDEFWDAEDKERDTMFKIIPRFIQPFLLRKIVPTSSSISGGTVCQQYFKGPGYYEIDMNTSMSSIARHAISIAKPMSTRVIFDIAFLIEGSCCEHLPELVLGAVRLYNLDLSVPLPSYSYDAQI